jgi:hypothetical protein
MKRIINLCDLIKFVERLATNKELFETYTIYILIYDGETDEIKRLTLDSFEYDKHGAACLYKDRTYIQNYCFASSIYNEKGELIAYYSEINGLTPVDNI